MAAAIPYAIAAIGTAASIKANNDAASERRNILNAQLTRDKEASDKTSQLVLDQAQNLYDPNKQQQAIDNQAQQVNAQEQKDLQQGAGGGLSGAVQTTGDAGNVSDDFIKAKADRAVQEGSRLTTLAKQMATTRAPGSLQTLAGYKNASLAGDLQNIASTNNNYANAAQADAAGVTTGNLGAFGTLATSLGAGMAAGGYGKAANLGGGLSGAGGGLGFKAPSGIQWG